MQADGRLSLDRLRLKRDKDKDHRDVNEKMGLQGKLIDDFIGCKITQPAVAFGKNLQYKVVKVFLLGCTCTYNCARL